MNTYLEAPAADDVEKNSLSPPVEDRWQKAATASARTARAFPAIKGRVCTVSEQIIGLGILHSQRCNLQTTDLKQDRQDGHDSEDDDFVVSKRWKAQPRADVHADTTLLCERRV